MIQWKKKIFLKKVKHKYLSKIFNVHLIIFKLNVVKKNYIIINFKVHLFNVYSIMKRNAELSNNAIKDFDTINHVHFEEDLCEIK